MLRWTLGPVHVMKFGFVMISAFVVFELPIEQASRGNRLTVARVVSNARG